jgi:hypothetical protein
VAVATSAAIPEIRHRLHLRRRFMRATPQMQKSLRRLITAGADELWLLSGVGTFAKSDDRTTSLPTGALDSESVWAIHRECLGFAERRDLEKLFRAQYITTIPNAGAFRCEFVCRGGTANLRFRREAEGVEVMSPSRSKPLRPLVARATPDESVHRDAPKSARRSRTSR